MRTWTLAVSIVFHLCVIAGVVVSPLLATGELPVPPRATEYVLVTASLPELPAPQRPVTRPTPTITAPLYEPDNVLPETPAPIADHQIPHDVDVAGGGTPGNGFVPNGVVTGDSLPPPPPPPPAPRQVYRVGGDIRAPQKIRDVAPRYPPIALASRQQGIVILEATISEDGAVRDVRVLRGKPLLDEAAAEAVRQWRFTQPLLNGQPVPVVMTVTVSFTLN